MRIGFKPFVEQIQFAVIGINMSMPAISGRIDTIKKIHPALYRFQNILRCANPHQIRRLIPGKVRHHRLDHAVHFFVCLPHRQSADGIPVQIHFGNLFGMIDTDVRINCSLIDSK